MREVICDTSPLQYLHQLDLLHILPSLIGRLVIPPAVQKEIAVGRAAGINLPDLQTLDWVTVRQSKSDAALPLITDMGPGEAEVILLALESRDALVILDDLLARRIAQAMEIPLTGTLGLLLDAKRAGLLPAVAPLLDRLHTLRFRLGASTRAAILKAAGEG